MSAGTILTGTHDVTLVALSFLIAVAASYTALDLATRVRASDGRARQVWLATAALAMGGGIWAMHFVAMLAFTIPGMQVDYNVGLTVVSLIVPVVVTGISFGVMTQTRQRPVLLLAAGLFMGLSIVTMHYLGMAAMKMTATLSYDRLWLAVSVLVAIGAATTALWLSLRTSRLPERIAAAVTMGIAVSGMHYTAMHAAVFTAEPGSSTVHGGSGLDQVALAVAVAASAFLILFLAMIAAMFDRRLAALTERESVALRKSEMHFRSLYKKTPLPLYTLDQSGRLERVSDAWLDLMGYRREEVAGRPFINFMSEASAQKAVQEDWALLLEEGELKDAEYRVVTKEGHLLDVIASARVEKDEQGTFICVLAGLTDVTDRKRAEEALRQAQKIEAIGQLTGGVAHDFNNLLAVVMGNLEMLRKRLPDDPHAARLLENALQGAQRGAGLTKRLLAFARRQELKPEAVDVPTLVHGMADMLQRSLGPGVQVETHFPLDLARAHVDGNQLELALVNLAVNARDAMPGGGTVSVSASEQTIVPSSPHGLKPGTYLCLSLTDSGSGMDPETLSRAIEPFFTTKGVGKGTGLGLSMVQGMAAQSGGRLVLASQVGGGTTVELWLPTVREQPSPERAQVDTAGSALSKDMESLTVLAVDDDALVLMNTAAMLEDLGHTVLQAASGNEALTLLKASASRVGLVVTDEAMPGMTGAQLAMVLRAERPHLPVLLVSGYGQVSPDLETDLPRLDKPFNQNALAQAVAKALRPIRADVLLRRPPHDPAPSHPER